MRSTLGTGTLRDDHAYVDVAGVKELHGRSPGADLSDLRNTDPRATVRELLS